MHQLVIHHQFLPKVASRLATMGPKPLLALHDVNDQILGCLGPPDIGGTKLASV